MWFVTFIIEGIIIIFCNILGILIFTKRASHSRACLLLVNQCLADFLVGIEVLFHGFAYHGDHTGITTYNNDSISVTESEKCANVPLLLSDILWSVTLSESLVSLALIALERVYAVFKPFKHRLLSKGTYFYAIIATWTFNIAQSLAFIFIHCYFNSKKLLDVVYGITFVCSACAFLILIFSYSAIYIKLKFFPIFQNTAHARNEYKMCRTLFYASLVSLITFIPVVFEQLYLRVNCFGMNSCLSSFFQDTAKAIVFSNSFINFFIYAWKFPGFNESVQKLLCCGKTANSRVGTN